MKYLIYATYGSNLLKKRFMVYIKGGNFDGRDYKSSSDKSEPKDLNWMYVPYRLYFAKKSSTWDNKGVAFLSCRKETDPDHYAVVRLWKISETQFEDIHEQEGKKYDKIITLEEKKGLKIKTITGCWEDEKQKPCERYLGVIRKGLKETTNWPDTTIEDYLDKFL